jgi:hypothetical protein
VECLLAIEPGWPFVRHREVNGGEIIVYLWADGHETGIEDRLVGVLVKERVADVLKGRLGDCMILLLEDESDNIAGFSRHRVWLERNLVWGRAPDGDFIDLGFPGTGDHDGDEGECSETSGKHDVRYVCMMCMG